MPMPVGSNVSPRRGLIFESSTDFVPAEFGPDDEVIRKLGPSGAYVFEFKDNCWRLTQELR